MGRVANTQAVVGKSAVAMREGIVDVRVVEVVVWEVPVSAIVSNRSSTSRGYYSRLIKPDSMRQYLQRSIAIISVGHTILCRDLVCLRDSSIVRQRLLRAIGALTSSGDGKSSCLEVGLGRAKIVEDAVARRNGDLHGIVETGLGGGFGGQEGQAREH